MPSGSICASGNSMPKAVCLGLVGQPAAIKDASCANLIDGHGGAPPSIWGELALAAR